MIFAAFAPLLQGGSWTWDEMLMLIVGLVLILTVGYFGHRSERNRVNLAQVPSTNGMVPHYRHRRDLLADGRIIYRANSQEITLEELQTTYRQVLTHFSEENDD